MIRPLSTLLALMGASVLFLTGCSGPPLRHVAVGWQGGTNGGSIIRTSIYALKWDEDDLYTLSNGNYPTGALRDVAVNPSTGRFVAVGRNPTTVGPGKAIYSDDMGVTWVPGDTCAMAKFVAVGENITLYSLDGMDWSIATAIPGHYHHLRSVARP